NERIDASGSVFAQSSFKIAKVGLRVGERERRSRSSNTPRWKVFPADVDAKNSDKCPCGERRRSILLAAGVRHGNEGFEAFIESRSGAELASATSFACARARHSLSMLAQGRVARLRRQHVSNRAGLLPHPGNAWPAPCRPAKN